ncbi:MAG: polysaccharide lyase family 8 super-sandwich domain-containing protein [Candidatus Latescibacteria bacterium]|jgi:chondroitin AC lyase|nr:polysaccharide lyase family 8 super-sandwich domain-containing protein [Candidatus Latescibacterota bacterium]
MADRPYRDMMVVRERLLGPLYAAPDRDEVHRLVETQKRDGSWADVDYADMSTVNWRPLEHLNRVLMLAQGYRAIRSAAYGDIQVRETISRGLDFWLKHDFIRPWWYETIGTPGVMSKVLLLFDGELTDAQREKGLEIVDRATMTSTGQNLVWHASIVAAGGILRRDPRRVARAYRRISREIRITTEEGIQPDFSFHQHGPCLYNHGYGADFTTDCARLAALLSGTAFAFPREKVDILTRYILDGSQWMARGRTPEYGAKGREITRAGQRVDYLRAACRHMLRVDTGREQEFRDLAARTSKRIRPPLEGNRHFWRADLMMHHRRGYTASARMHSDRNANTDGLSGCYEGLKSHLLADGCNYLYRTGEEYVDIFPAWDWRKVPGTTAVQGPERSGEPRRKGTTSFVGGVSDGAYGVAAFDLKRSGLVARKAWFFFDDEYVCLGAGITCQSHGRVATAVNQCHLRGKVVTGNGETVAAPSGETRSLEGPTWVHHDGVAYVFPEASDLRLRAGDQTGSWKLISSQSSDDSVAHDLFKLWIDHGTRPKAAEYAYTVVPDVTVGDAKRYARDVPVTVLRNERDLQAVRHRGLRLTGIAFYRPGTLAVSKALAVGVDRACLVMVRRRGKRLAVTAANPRNRKMTVNVTVSKRLSGEDVRRCGKGSSRVRIDLPGGMYAGQSVTRNVSVDGR